MTAVEEPVIIRSHRRTLALQVDVEARLVVRAPLRLAASQIESFIRRNAAWIDRQLEAARRRRQEVRPSVYGEGETFYYLGRAYPLALDPAAGRRLAFDGTRFVLPPPASPAQARARFVAWYRKEARRVLDERVRLYATQSGLSYRRLKITSARKRWGSCSSKGSLNFSWRLILASLDAVDYVVAHELAHLVHPNHSARFWAQVESIVPSFREPRLWLRRNQHLFDF